MLDHIGLNVADYATSRSFYERALALLGLSLMMEPSTASAASGPRQAVLLDRRPRGPADRRARGVTSPSREVVDALHAAALEAGGQDNGGPGLRPLYHPTYYAAVVLDRDGNNIEAVCHGAG